MDRYPLGIQRPAAPQRAVSGSYTLQHAPKRPTLPSRLSTVRSVSQPAHLVTFANDAVKPESRNAAAFLANREKIFTSPGAIENGTEDDVVERPSKRAKLGGQMKRSGSEEAWDSKGDSDGLLVALPGSALPSPPRQSSSSTAHQAQRRQISQAERAARRANGIEPPTMAARVPAPRKVVDFSPWSGQHPEDVMSETVVKSGYFDKAPGPNFSECNSAKATIWPNLSQKNNMGLTTLSHLFTCVMEKRQALGKCTAPSTFKPPPRVTVTDTKREAWLRDLANPEIPLRKQSRTIPHGIRGKLLMEQCLSKAIPMPRAVWLAKCVGANELRAFRRKGVSGAAAATGESKWVREWTIHVEQFLEGVIASAGQPDWQAKLDYAVKLTNAFYAEHLLDREHFLDWIVTAFIDASTDRLPTWIYLAQLYWNDIIHFQMRGRKLAEAMFKNLHEIMQGDVRVTDGLRIRLQKLIAVLAVTNRGCLVLPRTWNKYAYLLAPKALHVQHTNRTDVDAAAQNVIKRNQRLAGPFSQTTGTSRSASLDLYRLLDGLRLEIDIGVLSAHCLLIVADIPRLVSALLDWAGSTYRVGAARIYIVAKLLTKFHDDGHDVDGSVLAYLAAVKTDSLDIHSVHRVLCEVIRANAFSVGRYFQWLITSGVVSNTIDAPLATGLLLAIPLDGLPPHLSNTRQMLLGRLEAADDLATVDQIERHIKGSTSLDQSCTTETWNEIDYLCISAQHDLARRACREAKLRADARTLSLENFCTFKDIIESCRDYVSLGMLLESAIHCGSLQLLAIASDAVDLFADTFAATAQLHSLLEQVLESYRSLRSHQILNRTFVLSLLGLLARFPSEASFVQLLRSDLAVCEQQSSMAVCSPASDNLVSMQSSHLDSDHDIDAVFASGNTMDEQLMQRVFARILQRAGKVDTPSTDAPSKVCCWLNQLRSVDTIGFDELAKTFVQGCLQNATDRGAAAKVISALVASVCLKIGSVVDLARAAGSSSNAASVALMLLTEDRAVNSGLHVAEKFRFQVLRQRYCRSKAGDVMQLIALSMDSPKMPGLTPAVAQLMTTYAVKDSDAWLKHLPVATASRSPNYIRLMTQCLRPNFNSVDHNIHLDASSITTLATPLSIFLCVRALEILSLDMIKNEDGSNVDVLQDAILEAVSSGSEVWPQLLEKAGQETINGVYEWAREQVMTALNVDIVERDTVALDRNLEILDVAHRAAKGGEDGTIINTLAEKIKALDSTLASASTHSLFPGGADAQKKMLHGLHTLLHLCVLYSAPPSSTSASPTHSSPTEIDQSQSLLLATLLATLPNPALQPYPDTLEFISDVACYLSSPSILASLPKSTQFLAKRNPRVAALTGYTLDTDSWLALQHPIIAAAGPQTPGAGQQRSALMMKQAAAAAAARGAAVAQGVGMLARRASTMGGGGGGGVEGKVVPFRVRRWEMMSDAAPTVGENDTSLSLGMFAARKV